jgi:hypothetical protein
MAPLFSRYRGVILENESAFAILPERLQALALVRLCDEAVAGFEQYPTDKMCRWFGFVAGVLVTCGRIDGLDLGVMSEPDPDGVPDHSKKAVMVTLFDRYRSKILEKAAMLAPFGEDLQSASLISLCDEVMRGFDKRGFNETNVMLGFVQGVLATARMIDVDEERDFSRPLLHSLHKGHVPSFATDEKH